MDLLEHEPLHTSSRALNPLLSLPVYILSMSATGEEGGGSAYFNIPPPQPRSHPHLGPALSASCSCVLAAGPSLLTSIR